MVRKGKVVECVIATARRLILVLERRELENEAIMPGGPV
jgi:hypothetical protein